ncbi:hypothetical protein [Streptosporangium sp. KLBMP 9127]|nr:hypothetical protein [Streptosporangium sp. KLBMP 9127]
MSNAVRLAIRAWLPPHRLGLTLLVNGTELATRLPSGFIRWPADLPALFSATPVGAFAQLTRTRPPYQQ